MLFSAPSDLKKRRTIGSAGADLNVQPNAAVCCQLAAPCDAERRAIFAIAVIGRVWVLFCPTPAMPPIGAAVGTGPLNDAPPRAAHRKTHAATRRRLARAPVGERATARAELATAARPIRAPAHRSRHLPSKRCGWPACPRGRTWPRTAEVTWHSHICRDPWEAPDRPRNGSA